MHGFQCACPDCLDLLAPLRERMRQIERVMNGETVQFVPVPRIGVQMYRLNGQYGWLPNGRLLIVDLN